MAYVDQQVPTQMRALVYSGISSPPKVQSVETPTAAPGTAVVRVLAAKVNSYAREVYWYKGSNVNNRNYPFPVPFVPGGSAIARVVDTGPDATKLKPGDLVYLDNVVTSRDNSADLFIPGLMEGFTDGSKKLMTNVYRSWTYAEYCLAPLENLTVLNEQLLTGKSGGNELGYTVEELSYAAMLIVPYGGLRDINLKPGETLIVAPATGAYGGAAVCMALAMGARVIACGRSAESLKSLKRKVASPERLEIVQMKEEVEGTYEALKAFGRADAYLDIGPPSAAKSTHIKACILATGPRARISLMGGYVEDIAIPHADIVSTLKTRTYSQM